MEVGSYLRWLLDRFCHQLCSPVSGIPKPVVKKITQGVPGPLSLDDELVGCAHSLQFGPCHRITILAIAFPVSALNYSILKIAHRAWPAAYIPVASPAPHSDQQVPVLVLAFEWQADKCQFRCYPLSLPCGTNRQTQTVQRVSFTISFCLALANLAIPLENLPESSSRW